jgi:hypothetical protein
MRSGRSAAALASSGALQREHYKNLIRRLPDPTHMRFAIRHVNGIRRDEHVKEASKDGADNDNFDCSLCHYVSPVSVLGGSFMIDVNH